LKNIRKLFASQSSQVFLITWLVYISYYLCRKKLQCSYACFSHDLGSSNFDFGQHLQFIVFSIWQANSSADIYPTGLAPKELFAVGILIIIIANVMIGFSTKLPMFFLLMALNGLGQSTGWSGLIKILSKHFSHEKLGITMSWWTTSYVVGGFLAVIFATFWATDHSILPFLSWKRIFWAPSLILLLVGIIFLIVPVLPITINEIEILKQAENKNQHDYFKEIIKNSAVWIAALTYFFIKFIRYAFLFWLPLYFTQSLNYSTGVAGYSSSVFEIFGFAGVLIAGYVSDKLFFSRRFPVATIMLFCLSIIMVLHYSLASLGYWGNITAIAIIGIMVYGPDSIISGAAAIDLGKDAAGTAAGFINGVGSAGQIVSPLVVAFVTSHFGWDMLFRVFVFASLASALLLTIKWNYEKRLNTIREPIKL